MIDSNDVEVLRTLETRMSSTQSATALPSASISAPIPASIPASTPTPSASPTVGQVFPTVASRTPGMEEPPSEPSCGSAATACGQQRDASPPIVLTASAADRQNVIEEGARRFLREYCACSPCLESERDGSQQCGSRSPDTSLECVGDGAQGSRMEGDPRAGQVAALKRKLRGLLNRLTVDKFPAIGASICGLLEECCTEDYLYSVFVTMIIQTAVLRRHRKIGLYADLLHVLKLRAPLPRTPPCSPRAKREPEPPPATPIYQFDNVINSPHPRNPDPNGRGINGPETCILPPDCEPSTANVQHSQSLQYAEASQHSETSRFSGTSQRPEMPRSDETDKSFLTFVETIAERGRSVGGLPQPDSRSTLNSETCAEPSLDPRCDFDVATTPSAMDSSAINFSAINSSAINFSAMDPSAMDSSAMDSAFDSFSGLSASAISGTAENAAQSKAKEGGDVSRGGSEATLGERLGDIQQSRLLRRSNDSLDLIRSPSNTSLTGCGMSSSESRMTCLEAFDGPHWSLQTDQFWESIRVSNPPANAVVSAAAEYFLHTNFTADVLPSISALAGFLSRKRTLGLQDTLRFLGRLFALSHHSTCCAHPFLRGFTTKRSNPEKLHLFGKTTPEPATPEILALTELSAGCLCAFLMAAGTSLDNSTFGRNLADLIFWELERVKSFLSNRARMHVIEMADLRERGWRYARRFAYEALLNEGLGKDGETGDRRGSSSSAGEASDDRESRLSECQDTMGSGGASVTLLLSELASEIATCTSSDEYQRFIWGEEERWKCKLHGAVFEESPSSPDDNRPFLVSFSDPLGCAWLFDPDHPVCLFRAQAEHLFQDQMRYLQLVDMGMSVRNHSHLPTNTTPTHPTLRDTSHIPHTASLPANSSWATSSSSTPALSLPLSAAPATAAGAPSLISPAAFSLRPSLTPYPTPLSPSDSAPNSREPSPTLSPTLSSTLLPTLSTAILSTHSVPESHTTLTPMDFNAARLTSTVSDGAKAAGILPQDFLHLSRLEETNGIVSSDSAFAEASLAVTTPPQERLSPKRRPNTPYQRPLLDSDELQRADSDDMDVW